MGVDGLRLDAIPYLVEREGTNCENLPETHDVLKQLRAALDAEYPDRIFLAEANQWPSDVRAVLRRRRRVPHGVPLPAHAAHVHGAAQGRPHADRRHHARRRRTIPPDCQWAIFLRNHDELTLEMVTDEERDYMYREYARDPRMRINVGIRRRLAPLMDNGRRQIELMNALLMSMPGTPIIYYGDEIGMGDNIYLGDRNGVRTPMQWSADRNAGFSRARTPRRSTAPLIVDPPYGYHTVNVEAQERVPTSLLRWMRRLIARAAGVPGVRPRHVGAARRRRTGACSSSCGATSDETILCVNNLSRFAQYVELDLREFDGLVPLELWSKNAFPRIGELPYLLTLGPHNFLWFRLLRGEQAKEFQRAHVTVRHERARRSAPRSPRCRATPSCAFLAKQRWFAREGRVADDGARRRASSSCRGATARSPSRASIVGASDGEHAVSDPACAARSRSRDGSAASGAIVDGDVERTAATLYDAVHDAELPRRARRARSAPVRSSTAPTARAGSSSRVEQRHRSMPA